MVIIKRIINDLQYLGVENRGQLIFYLEPCNSVEKSNIDARKLLKGEE